MNIRNDDIADGNPKLTLGLIWTIILHFQVVLGLVLWRGCCRVGAMWEGMVPQGWDVPMGWLLWGRCHGASAAQ